MFIGVIKTDVVTGIHYFDLLAPCLFHYFYVLLLQNISISTNTLLFLLVDAGLFPASWHYRLLFFVVSSPIEEASSQRWVTLTQLRNMWIWQRKQVLVSLPS